LRRLPLLLRLVLAPLWVGRLEVLGLLWVVLGRLLVARLEVVVRRWQGTVGGLDVLLLLASVVAPLAVPKLVVLKHLGMEGGLDVPPLRLVVPKEVVARLAAVVVVRSEVRSLEEVHRRLDRLHHPRRSRRGASRSALVLVPLLDLCRPLSDRWLLLSRVHSKEGWACSNRWS
jgi:hypothetical protein